jgi:6-pyruvoyltetrahydropterin/6-carboxytetrahydropterin synthase
VPLHRVTTAIEFCYGHRLLDYEGKCRYLHGHNGLLEVAVDAEELNEQGMVMDFGDIRDQMKSWVDENIDHRMVLWRRDPLATVLIDMGEPVYLLDENPTAENIARHIFLRVSERGLRLSEVRLWETPSSCATYRGG